MDIYTESTGDAVIFIIVAGLMAGCQFFGYLKREIKKKYKVKSE